MKETEIIKEIQDLRIELEKYNYEYVRTPIFESSNLQCHTLCLSNDIEVVNLYSQ